MMLTPKEVFDYSVKQLKINQYNSEINRHFYGDITVGSVRLLIGEMASQFRSIDEANLYELNKLITITENVLEECTRLKWADYASPHEKKVIFMLLYLFPGLGRKICSNYKVKTSKKHRYIDIAFPSLKIGFECDSIKHHSAISELKKDYARAVEIQNLGWNIYSLRGEDIMSAPLEIMSFISQVFIDRKRAYEKN